MRVQCISNALSKEDERTRTDRRRVATANDDRRSLLRRLNARIQRRLRTLRKAIKLKDAGWTIPQDRLARQNRLGKELARLFSGVETHPTIGNTLAVRRVTDLSVFGEFVGGHVIDGEDEFDVVLLRLFDELFDLFRSVFVEERVADPVLARSTFSLQSNIGDALDAIEGLLEGKGHPAADDELVDLVEQVVDELNLVRDFGAAEDGKERSFRVLEGSVRRIRSRGGLIGGDTRTWRRIQALSS